MARPLRIEYEGAFYHVTSRGNDRQPVSFGARDVAQWREYLGEAIVRYDCRVHAYVFMTNHYHLVIETLRPNLSRAMHFLNGSYTTYINTKHRRNGHLFQGRFKALVVDRDAYLLALSRYVHLNPVRAGLAARPEAYPFSSYREFVTGTGDGLVTTDVTLGLMPGDRHRAADRYRRFVEDGMKQPPADPLAQRHGGLIVGSEAFVRQVLGRVDRGRLARTEVSGRRALTRDVNREEVVRAASEVCQVSRSEILASRTPRADARSVAIYVLKRTTGLTNRDLGQFFGGVGPSAIAQTARRVAARLGGDQRLAETVDRVLSQVKG
ncbi:MAG: transposase [Nitrospirota bacterium]